MSMDGTDRGRVSDALEEAPALEAQDNQQTEVVVETKPKKGRKKGSKVQSQAVKPRQLATLLEYTAKGLPIEQAARAAKMPPSTAHRVVKRYAGWIQDLDEIKDFESVRSQILTAGEMRLLESMLRDDKLEKASVNNVAYALRQVHDMRRLHQGLSTANVATQRVEVSIPKKTD